MQMNIQTNIMIIIIFITFPKIIMIFTMIYLKYLILKKKFLTKVQTIKISILLYRN